MSGSDNLASASDIWRAVVGSEDRFHVSSSGLIRNVHTGRLVKLTRNDRGYLCCGVPGKSGRKVRKVHIMVAEAFIGPRQTGQQLTFIDGDKNNCCAVNLAYGTATENAQIQVQRLGKAISAKLDPWQVVLIKKCIKENVKMTEIAKEFSVSYGTIKKIKYGSIWTRI